MNCFDRKRFEANKELVILLGKLVCDNPSMRFGQVLRNFEFIRQEDCPKGAPYHWFDEFNTEPQVVLDRVKDAVKRLRP